MQFADDHPSDEVLEGYAMNRLAGPLLASFEEHLLVCRSCQDRLAEEDRSIQAIRDAGTVSISERPKVFGFPAVARWAALAAAALLIFVVLKWQFARQPHLPPVAIFLQATRGPVSQTAPARKPLALSLDSTDLAPFAEYQIEVVNSAGSRVARSRAVSHANSLQYDLSDGLPAGAYFVRVYSPSKELLREFALVVRG